MVMPSMIDGGDVDVRPFIKVGYKPVYCNGSIEKLIKLKPVDFNKQQRLSLKASFFRWYSENYSDKVVDSTFDLMRNTKYQYSYIITDYPVDVYKTEVKINNKNIKLYIRLDKDTLITPYAPDSWVESSCDEDKP
jgi:hypothetical protein